MIQLPVDAHLLRSLSVTPDEVSAVEIKPGEMLLVCGEPVVFDRYAVAMVDRLDTISHTCTMIRQVLNDVSPLHEWSQNYIEPNCKVRAWAKEHNCPRVTVPGGIPPLTRGGQVAVPDFNMSGTSWYIVHLVHLSGFEVKLHFEESR